MTNERDLRAALSRLSTAAPREAGPAVEFELRRVLQRARRQRRQVRWYFAAAVVACMLASLAAVGWFQIAQRSQKRPPASAVPLHSVRNFADEGFVALPYGQSDVPLEHGVVLRVEIDSGAGPVPADLLVGQDGLARAVRLAR